MKQGDLIRTQTDNPPKWRKGVKAEIVALQPGAPGPLVDFGEAGQHVVPFNQLTEAVCKLQLFPDVEIWVCNKDEANELARENRGEAWRIWLQEEVTQYRGYGEAGLRAIVEKKREKPGPYLKEEQK